MEAEYYTSNKTSVSLKGLDSTLVFVAYKVNVNNTYLTKCSVYYPPDNVVIYDELFTLRDSLL